MSIKVKISAMFQSATNGVSMAEVKGSTIGECLKQVSKDFPALGKMLFDETDKLSGWLTVILNGQYVGGDLMTVPVKSGDEIFPLILIQGG